MYFYAGHPHIAVGSLARSTSDLKLVRYPSWDFVLGLVLPEDLAVPAILGSIDDWLMDHLR